MSLRQWEPRDSETKGQVAALWNQITKNSRLGLSFCLYQLYWHFQTTPTGINIQNRNDSFQTSINRSSKGGVASEIAEFQFMPPPKINQFQKMSFQVQQHWDNKVELNKHESRVHKQATRLYSKESKKRRKEWLPGQFVRNWMKYLALTCCPNHLKYISKMVLL